MTDHPDSLLLSEHLTVARTALDSFALPSRSRIERMPIEVAAAMMGTCFERRRRVAVLVGVARELMHAPQTIGMTQDGAPIVSYDEFAAVMGRGRQMEELEELLGDLNNRIERLEYVLEFRLARACGTRRSRAGARFRCHSSAMSLPLAALFGYVPRRRESTPVVVRSVRRRTCTGSGRPRATSRRSSTSRSAGGGSDGSSEPGEPAGPRAAVPSGDRGAA